MKVDYDFIFSCVSGQHLANPELLPDPLDYDIVREAADVVAASVGCFIRADLKPFLSSWADWGADGALPALMPNVSFMDVAAQDAARVIILRKLLTRCWQARDDRSDTEKWKDIWTIFVRMLDRAIYARMFSILDMASMSSGDTVKRLLEQSMQFYCKMAAALLR